jgi:hypothetical protein
MFEPGVVVLVDEGRLAVNADDRTSGIGSATRGRPQVRQQ